jgi:hypothetical protein
MTDSIVTVHVVADIVELKAGLQNAAQAVRTTFSGIKESVQKTMGTAPSPISAMPRRSSR